MARIQSFDVETDAGAGKVRNRHGPSVSSVGGPSPSPSGSSAGNNIIMSSTNTGKTYFMCALAAFVFYGIGRMIYPAETQNYDERKQSRGDAVGGRGIEHKHPVVSNSTGKASSDRIQPSYQSPQSLQPPSSSSSQNMDNVAATDNAEHELWESDLLQLISPLVVIPSHPVQEYQKYQTTTTDPDLTLAVTVLNDKSTPHGKAFDFMLNRDTRPHDDHAVLLLEDDLQKLVQRFVVTLLFYATGGRDTTRIPMQEGEMRDKAIEGGARASRRSGWESSTAHFLSGLHECHWLKKSLEDQFWALLSVEKDTDRRVGVTKCNANMEVTEICLGAYYILLPMGRSQHI